MGDHLRVKIQINNVDVFAIIDTGAVKSLIS